MYHCLDCLFLFSQSVVVFNLLLDLLILVVVVEVRVFFSVCSEFPTKTPLFSKTQTEVSSTLFSFEVHRSIRNGGSSKSSSIDSTTSISFSNLTRPTTQFYCHRLSLPLRVKCE